MTSNQTPHDLEPGVARMPSPTNDAAHKTHWNPQRNTALARKRKGRKIKRSAYINQKIQ